MYFINYFPTEIIPMGVYQMYLWRTLKNKANQTPTGKITCLSFIYLITMKRERKRVYSIIQKEWCHCPLATPWIYCWWSEWITPPWSVCLWPLAWGYWWLFQWKTCSKDLYLPSHQTITQDYWGQVHLYISYCEINIIHCLDALRRPVWKLMTWNM